MASTAAPALSSKLRSLSNALTVANICSVFQAVTKAQDRTFVRRPGVDVELRERAVQLHVEEGVFHCRVGQAELLLREVDSQ